MSTQTNTAVTIVTDVTRPVELPRRSDCLVVIHDEGRNYVRKRWDLVSSTTRIGRGSKADIVLECNGISRKHARIERSSRGCVLIDEGSRNGTLVNDQRVQAPYVLRSGDLIRLDRIILRFLSGNDIEREYQEVIFRLTEFDAMTELATRRRFDDELGREFNRARRYGRSLSLLLLDIDHFKAVNDTYGHAVGDLVLKQVANAIRARARATDVAARVGGEELGLVMPETALGDAVAFAEELRRAIASSVTLVEGARIRVTASIGCAQLREDASAAELYARCDAKLYQAKNTGRNRVGW